MNTITNAMKAYLTFLCSHEAAIAMQTIPTIIDAMKDKLEYQINSFPFGLVLLSSGFRMPTIVSLFAVTVLVRDKLE